MLSPPIRPPTIEGVLSFKSLQEATAGCEHLVVQGFLRFLLVNLRRRKMAAVKLLVAHAARKLGPPQNTKGLANQNHTEAKTNEEKGIGLHANYHS